MRLPAFGYCVLGKTDGEARAFPFAAGDRDGTAQHLADEIVDDVQPQPGAARAALGGEERVEDLGQEFFRDAVAVVAEIDGDAAGPRLRHPDTDAAGLLAAPAAGLHGLE